MKSRLNVKKRLLSIGVLLAAFFMASCMWPPAHAAATVPVIIQGTVTNNGQPIVGIAVIADCNGGLFDGTFLGSTNTDAAGHYVIHTSDNYCNMGSLVVVTADTNGNNDPETEVEGTLQPVVTLDIAVSFVPPDDTGQFTLSGLVTSHDTNKPIGGATVMIRCPDNDFFTTVTTDASGKYSATLGFPTCRHGKSIYAMVGFNSDGYRISEKSGWGWSIIDDNMAPIDIEIFSGGTIEVPEFGWLGGLFAAGAGIGAVAFARRRLAKGDASVTAR